MKDIYIRGIKLLLIILTVRIILSSGLSTLYTMKFFTFIYALFFLSVENFLYNALPNLLLLWILSCCTYYIHSKHAIKLILYILLIQVIVIFCGYYFMEDFQILFNLKASVSDIIERFYFSGYRFLSMSITYTLFVIIYYYKIDLPYQKMIEYSK